MNSNRGTGLVPTDEACEMGKTRKKTPTSRKKKNVFIIHGRDVRTLHELQEFVMSLGFSILKFEDLANRRANSFIADIVLEGINAAALVIALFTPDEVAAFYDGFTLSHERSSRRWQARPNVIFEAGVAYGLKRDETILVTAGADVELFSDLSGVHFIRLDSPSGREDLRKRIFNIVKEERPQKATNESKEFLTHLTPRWDFFDELDVLESLTKETVVKYKSKRVRIFDVLRDTVRAKPNARWGSYSADAFMNLVYECFSDSVAEDSFWSLYMWGFFQPTDIEQWFDYDETWEGSVEYCELSLRGKAFLQKLQSQIPSS